MNNSKETATSHMYAEAKTWSPFKGCLFGCAYCVPSFQKQAKRQMHNCMKCYKYIPHFHKERLEKIPSAKIVFVCGNADIAFANAGQVTQIIGAIKKHNERTRSRKTFYLQSKRPACLEPFLEQLPENVILLTTMETNRDAEYEKVSKAPVPSERYKQFLALKYGRKAVTVEPVMDFDVDVFSKWILDIRPEYVWLGFDSRDCGLPEPTEAKMREFTAILAENGIPVKGKTLRGMDLPGVVRHQD